MVGGFRHGGAAASETSNLFFFKFFSPKSSPPSSESIFEVSSKKFLMQQTETKQIYKGKAITSLYERRKRENTTENFGKNFDLAWVSPFGSDLLWLLLLCKFENDMVVVLESENGSVAVLLDFRILCGLVMNFGFVVICLYQMHFSGKLFLMFIPCSSFFCDFSYV